MRSHIHELWEDLELSPQYPEPDLDRVMDRVMDQIKAEEPERPASQTRRRRPMHKKKLLLSLAAALAASAVDTGLLRKPFGLFLLWSGGTMLLGAFRRPDSGQTEE